MTFLGISDKITNRMKFIYVATIGSLCLAHSCTGVCLDSDISTHPEGFAHTKDSGNYHDACMAAIKGQIKMEFQGHLR